MPSTPVECVRCAAGFPPRTRAPHRPRPRGSGPAGACRGGGVGDSPAATPVRDDAVCRCAPSAISLAVSASQYSAAVRTFSSARRAAAACADRPWALRSWLTDSDSRATCVMSSATCAASDRPGRRLVRVSCSAAARSTRPVSVGVALPRRSVVVPCGGGQRPTCRSLDEPDCRRQHVRCCGGRVAGCRRVSRVLRLDRLGRGTGSRRARSHSSSRTSPSRPPPASPIGPPAVGAAPASLQLGQAQVRCEPTTTEQHRLLVSVETRKVFNTRAGRWLTISIVGLVLLVVGIGALAFPEDAQDYVSMLGLSGGVLGYFLPILMIMLVTSEWGQRTGLATFTLEPRRPRVIGAKIVAGLGLAVVVLAIGAVIAAMGVALSPANGGEAVWNLGLTEVRSFLLSSLVSVLVGFALAMLLRNSAAAIVAYFVYTLILPTVAVALGGLVDDFDKIAPWVEFNTAQMPLFAGDYSVTGQEWAQIAVSGTIWLVIPFALGLLRLVKAEVK